MDAPELVTVHICSFIGHFAYINDCLLHGLYLGLGQRMVYCSVIYARIDQQNGSTCLHHRRLLRLPEPLDLAVSLWPVTSS